MSPSANHKPRLSMWGMLLMLAQLPPNANNCNVLATIKHSTQTLYIHTQACARRRTYWSQWHTWGNSRPRALPRLSFQLITKLKPPFAAIPPYKFYPYGMEKDETALNHQSTSPSHSVFCIVSNTIRISHLIISTSANNCSHSGRVSADNLTHVSYNRTSAHSRGIFVLGVCQSSHPRKIK